MERQIEVQDFEPLNRTYWVQTTSAFNATRAAPAPLLLSFHGQTDTAHNFALKHSFGVLGAEHGLIAVFPQGMGDSIPEEDQGTGWNVDSGGLRGNATCVPEGVGTSGGCYKSCRKLGLCGRCNWSTCHDDHLFVRTLLRRIAQDFCIDLNRIYVQGESNGAELLTHLVHEMPGTFAAVSPWYGTPLLGFLLGRRMQLVVNRAGVMGTALLSLHGRNDTTIPPGGGVSDGGWIFESVEQVGLSWAALHGCSLRAAPLPTRWDGGPKRFACAEHRQCQSGRRVVSCHYDGVHGDWPSGTDGDEITMWFFLQFSRGRPVTGGEQSFVV